PTRYATVSLFHPPSPPPTYPLSLHDALPIFGSRGHVAEHDLLGHAPAQRNADPRLELHARVAHAIVVGRGEGDAQCHAAGDDRRSEEHTSELQSRGHLVCRLLLEKKKTKSAT